MVNGLGVVGWGVGGIEAEAAMLGQPISMLIPEVLGVRLKGRLPEGATATDLVLTVTELLRKQGVVGKFVEFFGAGAGDADRSPTARRSATCRRSTARRSPSSRSTTMTLDYLRLTGRATADIALVEAYTKAQGLFRTDATPEATYAAVIEVDLGGHRAEPRRPAPPAGSRLARRTPSRSSAGRLGGDAGGAEEGRRQARARPRRHGRASTPRAGVTPTQIDHGAVVVAAITSCTNTSNPSVMIGAGLARQEGGREGA